MQFIHRSRPEIDNLQAHSKETWQLLCSKLILIKNSYPVTFSMSGGWTCKDISFPTVHFCKKFLLNLIWKQFCLSIYIQQLLRKSFSLLFKMSLFFLLVLLILKHLQLKQIPQWLYSNNCSFSTTMWISIFILYCEEQASEKILCCSLKNVGFETIQP